MTTTNTKITAPTATTADAAADDGLGSPTPVDRFIASVEQGRPLDLQILHPEVALDATVPNWRFHRQGADAVATELAGFYDGPGHLELVRRVLLPGGELVEITRSWTEDGVPHLSHQAHVIDLTPDGRIVRDTLFCGGRWPADLLAEMEAADADA